MAFVTRLGQGLVMNRALAVSSAGPLLALVLGLSGCRTEPTGSDAPGREPSPEAVEPTEPSQPSEPAEVGEDTPKSEEPQVEQAAERAKPTGDDVRKDGFRVRSDLLSDFHGEDVEVVSTILVPPNWDPDKEHLPVALHVHGFGGTDAMAARRAKRPLRAGLEDGTWPRMIYVYLDANVETGHHVFADSANNGPWSRALVEEFVPALEARYGAVGKPHGRFLTGHSSGGWSTFWLMVDHPDFFGGTWPTAPDPVDFRSFTGIDIYDQPNAYKSPDGSVVQLVRRGETFVTSFEEYTRQEVKTKPVGGQIYSFDAVFSPRGKDDKPVFLFDRETGVIDPEVAQAWKAYDIGLILRTQWEELGPKLAGKVHVYCGTLDTFRLNEALDLLQDDLEKLPDGDKLEIVMVEGRDHFDLYNPQVDHYPDGLTRLIYGEMQRTFEAASAP